MSSLPASKEVFASEKAISLVEAALDAAIDVIEKANFARMVPRTKPPVKASVEVAADLMSLEPPRLLMVAFSRAQELLSSKQQRLLSQTDHPAPFESWAVAQKSDWAPLIRCRFGLRPLTLFGTTASVSLRQRRPGQLFATQSESPHRDPRRRRRCRPTGAAAAAVPLFTPGQGFSALAAGEVLLLGFRGVGG